METSPKQSAENFVKEVRRKTRRVFTSEQKILIVMEAMRGEMSVAAICRKYGIANTVFYKWNKEFMEARKKRLHGDSERQATTDEVAELRKENQSKINQHGQRADGIVKDMLQHARSTTGQKEPTDINTLADEYLRLSDQGLRARDKDFNSTAHSDFDSKQHWESKYYTTRHRKSITEFV